MDQDVDMIWEYQGPQAAEPAEFDSEDILLEMERLLYEDLREESIRKGFFVCVPFATFSLICCITAQVLASNLLSSPLSGIFNCKYN